MIDGRRSDDAQQRANNDCPLALEQSKKDVAQLYTGVMLDISSDFIHSLTFSRGGDRSLRPPAD